MVSWRCLLRAFIMNAYICSKSHWFLLAASVPCSMLYAFGDIGYCMLCAAIA